jgi:hypothetical protein
MAGQTHFLITRKRGKTHDQDRYQVTLVIGTENTQEIASPYSLEGAVRAVNAHNNTHKQEILCKIDLSE